MSELPILTRAQVRRVDQLAIQELGLPGIALMENAGNGAASLLLNQPNLERVVVCAAGGNNGGDGFVIARHLWLAGKQVSIWLMTDPNKLSGDALINYQVALRLGLPIHVSDEMSITSGFIDDLENADWVVDALFGTGLSSDVREPYATIIQCLNDSQTPVMSVDLPSGLDCDRGVPLGAAVRADMTVTFVAEKIGFQQPEAAQYLGQVEVVSIGVPWDLETRMNTDNSEPGS